jgi:hypothetical protein
MAAMVIADAAKSVEILLPRHLAAVDSKEYNVDC